MFDASLFGRILMAVLVANAHRRKGRQGWRYQAGWQADRGEEGMLLGLAGELWYVGEHMYSVRSASVGGYT